MEVRSSSDLGLKCVSSLDTETQEHVVVSVFVVVVYGGQCGLLHIASSQAYHFNLKKEIFQLNIVTKKIEELRF